MNARDRVEDVLHRLADPADDASRSFRQVYANEARAAANAADDRRRRSMMLGRLDGKIVSVKDLFDIAGSVTTAGARLREAEPPAKTDAIAVARLRQAGAILIGRTVMSEFAFSGIGINPHHGTPGNPWDRLRIPGGSSSGAAVSVADGIADIGLGSDTGGSLRIPAALCGLVGFKPGIGTVPTEGAFPLAPTLDVIGPIGRSVVDCADAFSVLASLDITDSDKPQSLSCVRIGVVDTPELIDGQEPAVSAAFGAAIRRIEAAGGVLVHTTLADVMQRVSELRGLGLFPAVELAATLAGLDSEKRALIDPLIAARLSPGEAMLATDYIAMQNLRIGLETLIDNAMEYLDLLVLPTVPIQAPLFVDVENQANFHQKNILLLRNTSLFNLANLPAISLPIAGGEGLPIGVSLVGKRGQEQKLLGLAAAVEPIFN